MQVKFVLVMGKLYNECSEVICQRSLFERMWLLHPSEGLIFSSHVEGTRPRWQVLAWQSFWWGRPARRQQLHRAWPGGLVRSHKGRSGGPDPFLRGCERLPLRMEHSLDAQGRLRLCLPAGHFSGETHWLDFSWFYTWGCSSSFCFGDMALGRHLEISSNLC